MGHNTFLSINSYLIVPWEKSKFANERYCFVLTDKTEYKYPKKCTPIFSIEKIEETVKKISPDIHEIFIIGGASLYSQFINKAKKLYITEVQTEIDGDAFFPEMDEIKWKLVEEKAHLKDKKHPYSFVFKVYEKIN